MTRWVCFATWWVQLGGYTPYILLLSVHRNNATHLKACRYCMYCMMRLSKNIRSHITWNASELEWRAISFYAPIERSRWELSIGIVLCIAPINSSLTIEETVIRVIRVTRDCSTNLYSALTTSPILYNCIALHCILLHCIAFYCIALHCIALHCIVCVALHCILCYPILSYPILSCRVH